MGTKFAVNENKLRQNNSHRLDDTSFLRAFLLSGRGKVCFVLCFLLKKTLFNVFVIFSLLASAVDTDTADTAAETSAFTTSSPGCRSCRPVTGPHSTTHSCSCCC